jgi:hypothetical protein
MCLFHNIAYGLYYHGQSQYKNPEYGLMPGGYIGGGTARAGGAWRQLAEASSHRCGSVAIEAACVGPPASAAADRDEC